MFWLNKNLWTLQTYFHNFELICQLLCADAAKLNFICDKKIDISNRSEWLKRTQTYLGGTGREKEIF